MPNSYENMLQLFFKTPSLIFKRMPSSYHHDMFVFSFKWLTDMGWRFHSKRHQCADSDERQRRAPLGRVERPPGVEDEAVSVRVCDLDATPADLLGCRGGR